MTELSGEGLHELLARAVADPIAVQRRTSALADEFVAGGPDAVSAIVRAMSKGYPIAEGQHPIDVADAVSTLLMRLAFHQRPAVEALLSHPERFIRASAKFAIRHAVP